MSNYPKILTLGHRYLENLFKNPVLIEEKVDGSQYSFGKVNGKVFYRSKGRELFQPVEDKLFKAACDYVDSIADKLPEGYTFRGEVLRAPKHNTICYGRVPNNNIVIFDIDAGTEAYMPYNQKAILAETVGLETVPKLFEGEVTNVEDLRKLLDTMSFLGESKVEGIVIKNYNQIGVDNKVLMGKWVREEFKEANGARQKADYPQKEEIIQGLITVYKTENRWLKAVQHLRDNGTLLNEPKDIGLLMKEVNQDVLKECEEEIKEALWKYAWPRISRGIVGGLPDWYKDQLARRQFDA